MIGWFQSLNSLEMVFLACATVGGLLFLARFVLMFVVGAHGDSTGADAGGTDLHGGGADVDAGSADASGGSADHAHDADVTFKFLSLQGITAFFMMFGLVGLAMSRGSNLHFLFSIAGGLVAGVLTVWILDRLFRLFGRMQHSGTVDLRNAVGQEGRVYMRITEKEPGKIQISIQGRLMTLDAVAADGKAIMTDEPVKVMSIRSGSMLVVERSGRN